VADGAAAADVEDDMDELAAALDEASAAEALDKDEAPYMLEQ
jgi:hypothetical protein